jgi:hypothetical protein
MPFSRLAAQRVANLPQNRPSPGHLSALYLLPYVVTAVAGVFDAMHNILLGVNKTLWRSCVVQGEYKTNKGPVESGNRSASETETDDVESNGEGSTRGSQGLFGPRPPRVATLRLDDRVGDKPLTLTAHQLSLIKDTIRTVSGASKDRLMCVYAEFQYICTGDYS